MDEFTRLKAKAQQYSDLAFVRPLTDKEHKNYKKTMEKMFGKDNLAKALGGQNGK